jgi:hypothetical protein
MHPLRESSCPFSERIVAVDHFLDPADFAFLRDTALNLANAKRVHIPLHKRGATISYHNLLHSAAAIPALYHSMDLRNWCSNVVGEKLYLTAHDDLSSCSILIYDKARDHIRSHYDLNFYRGRHFTALLSLVNTNSTGDGLSSAKLFIVKDNAKTIVPTPPNSLVLFEGARVRHGVTPLRRGECRIIMSMTYCANPSASRVQGVQRRFKDIAYFGLRALWN